MILFYFILRINYFKNIQYHVCLIVKIRHTLKMYNNVFRMYMYYI